MSETNQPFKGTKHSAHGNDDDTIVERRTLRDYYIIMRERVWVALPIALVVSLAFFAWQKHKTPIYQAVATYGFMQEPNVPDVLRHAMSLLRLSVNPDETTYYLGRENVQGGQKGTMGAFAESLFSYLQRNAVAADRHFHIPPRQVIEIGIQLDV